VVTLAKGDIMLLPYAPIRSLLLDGAVSLI